VKILRALGPLSERLGLIFLFPCVIGCEEVLPPTSVADCEFSHVYSHFKPHEEFARLKFDVDAETDGGRISPRERYGWRPYQGSLVLPQGTAGCNAAALAIRQGLERTLGSRCVDELNLNRQRARGRPFYGMLRYLQGQMRGCIYIWLFPNKSETTMHYAILLHEERVSREPLSAYAALSIRAETN
jgi:hypothetical protein